MSNGQMLHSSPPEAEKPRGGMIDRLLLAHPRTVGETYTEHAGIAGRFGLTMVMGGLKCLVHAILPAVFMRSASDSVAKLHGELERRRRASADSDPDYVI
ncbi:MAG TPA: DUF6356 family protein [Qipengyuania sp.]|nr:DUF6356 family protein [Qipengyuania sp.]